MRSVTVYLLSIFAGACQVVSAGGNQGSVDTCEERARAIIATLPHDGMLRLPLEIGHRGDGIHHGWMDEMKRRGVKHVNGTVRFSWDHGIKSLELPEIRYLTDYEGSSVLVTSQEVLGRFRDDGFEATMREALFEKARERIAKYMAESAADRAYGKLRLNVLDDPCLPTLDPLPQICPEDKTPLINAVIETSSTDLNRFAAAGVDTEPCDELFPQGSIHNSIEALLASGVDINERDSGGYTALMFAARDGKLDILQLLIHAGADVNIRSKQGETALRLAKRFGHKEVIKVLKRAGGKE